MNNLRLYQLREYHNLTQKDVANILGVKQQTYFEWEKGNKIIPLKHLVTICKYYGVSLDYITGLSKTSGSISKNFVLNKDVIGKRLTSFRNSKKILQKDIAKILNTTPSTICAYEKGNTTILTIFAYQICKHYNISFDWLIGAK